MNLNLPLHYYCHISGKIYCDLSHLSSAPVDLHGAVAVIVVVLRVDMSVPLSRDLGAKEPATTGSTFRMQSKDERKHYTQYIS